LQADALAGRAAELGSLGGNTTSLTVFLRQYDNRMSDLREDGHSAS
jgi:hypothetical protein